jgi:hypothetical protein
VAFDSAVLSVENCYVAEMSLPPSGTVCMGDTASVSVTVGNAGTKKDSYTLTYPGGSKEFSLGPGGKADMDLSFTADYPWGSERNATFTLKSANGAEAEGSVLVTTLGKEKCYAVGVPDAGMGKDSASDAGTGDGILVAQALRGKGTTAAVMFGNAGFRTDTYALSISGPDWAYLSTDEVTLEPGENATAYVYLSPSYDTQEGTYNVTVMAESENTFQKVLLQAEVADSFPDAGASSEGGMGLSGMFVWSGLAAQAVVLTFMALFMAVILAMRFVIYK